MNLEVASEFQIRMQPSDTLISALCDPEQRTQLKCATLLTP